MNKSIEKTIIALSTAFTKEADERNGDLINDLNEKFQKNEQLYETEMDIAFMDFSRFAALPWLKAHPDVTDGKDIFLIESIYNGLLTHFVRKVVENSEGTPFSADKERFIIRKIKESVVTGHNISLYSRYGDRTNLSESEKNEQAYWSPSCFKDTDDVKERFFKWYDTP